MMRNTMAISIAFFFLAVQSSGTQAQETPAKVLHVYKTFQADGKYQSREITAALVNMSKVMDAPGDNCGQFVGTIKVEGIQFSPSGGTLESFRFTDKKGNQWSVPTNIGTLSNVARQDANNFIRVGKAYYGHVQSCGSGGFADLVSMYDSNITFGAF